MSDLPESPTWIGEEEAEDWAEDEDDEGSCGAFGQRLFSFGSEECEFCPLADACRSGTLQHGSMRGGSSP